MKFTLAEPKYFKDSITIISDLVSEARFSISPESIQLVAMDPANVAMVIFRMMPTLFEKYEVTEKVDITLNLTNLRQILRRAGTSDTIDMELEKGGAKLKMTINGRTTRRFSLPIIAADEREQKTPNLTFPLTVTSPVEILSEAVEDASVVADSLVFESDGKKLQISAAGDLNNLEVDMDPESMDIVSELESSARSRYAIEYLKKMIGGAKLSDTVKIQFNKDYPLRLEYVTVDKVQLAFILAPRVEHE